MLLAPLLSCPGARISIIRCTSGEKGDELPPENSRAWVDILSMELQGVGWTNFYLQLLIFFVFMVLFPQYYFFFTKMFAFKKRIFRHAVGGSYKHLHFFFCSCLATGNQCCRCNCIMLQCFCRQSYQKCSKMNCQLSFDCAKIFWFCGKFTGFLSRVCWLLQQPQQTYLSA